MHSTWINGFGKPTRLSTWQQMVRLKAFVVLMLELAATWTSYHLINNDAATVLVGFVLPRGHCGCWQFHDGKKRNPRHSGVVVAKKKKRGGGVRKRVLFMCYVDTQISPLNYSWLKTNFHGKVQKKDLCPKTPHLWCRFFTFSLWKWWLERGEIEPLQILAVFKAHRWHYHCLIFVECNGDVRAFHKLSDHNSCKKFRKELEVTD